MDGFGVCHPRADENCRWIENHPTKEKGTTYFLTYFCKLSRNHSVRKIPDDHLLTFGRTKRCGVGASGVSNSGAQFLTWCGEGG